MKVLVISIPPNSVIDSTRKIKGIDLHVYEISVCNEETKHDINQYIKDFRPDVIITYRCPFILEAPIYSIASIGAFNIHPSLLPLYRGLNPWKSILKSKDHRNGVTIHEITDIPDTGNIKMQIAYNLSSSDTITSARAKADVIAGNMIKDFICTIKSLI